MKSIPHYLAVVTVFAAGISSIAGAASSESHAIEKHIVVTRDAGKTPAGESSKPVTYLGVAVTPVEGALAAQLQLGEGQGLVVNFVEPDSPADVAGLRQHDVLTRLDDQILIEPRQLSVLVRNRSEGDTIAITYLRAGREEQVGVTLAQHVPAPSNVLQWFGKGTPDIVYRAHNLGPLADIDVHRIQRAPNGDFTVPLTPALNALRHSGLSDDRVMIFRPQTNIVFSDESGTLIVNTNESGRVLTAKDAAGEVIFEGGIDTPEQREQLPAGLRQRLEKLEKLDVMDAPQPPVPPAPPRSTGIAPAVGIGRANGVI